MCATALSGSAALPQLGFASQPGPQPQKQTSTEVTLRWGKRPGVSRYRLQLSHDQDFADIVFDLVVTGNEYRTSELEPGRYFWRVTAITGKTPEFLSAGVIEVRNELTAPNPGQSTRPTNSNQNIASTQPRGIATAGGWYAAIGDVSETIAANLRSPNAADIVAANGRGDTFALDAATGVALWTARAVASARSNASVKPPIAVKSANGLDNVLSISGNVATLREGRTGRQIWRASLPAFIFGATALNQGAGTRVFFLDYSLQKIFVLGAADGKTIEQIPLPRRVVGLPAVIEYQTTRGVIIALDYGRVEIFDANGKFIRSGDAGSAATTAPLFVNSTRRGLVLIGTRGGLTAMSTDDLRPLGRVALKNDAPLGILAARDIDSDGIAEVIMFTERGQIVVIKSDEGRIVWQSDSRGARSIAFADLNSDHVLDLLMTGRDSSTFALSGRDGSFLWKDDAASGLAANHASSSTPRAALIAPSLAGPLLVAPDPARGGLRAIAFAKSTGN